MLVDPATELSDAGGPARSYWQPTWPARVRSSGLVRRFCHDNSLANHPATGQLLTVEVNIHEKALA